MRDQFADDHLVSVAGQEVLKKDLINDPALTQHIPTLDSYFKRMSIQKAVETVVENKEVLDFATTNLFLSPEFEEEKKLLDEKIQQFQNIASKRKKEELPPVIELHGTTPDTDSLAKMLFNILEEQETALHDISSAVEGGGSGGAALIDRTTTQYSFREPTDLVTDGGFKSEFETLFPGFWNSINLKEISLTKNQKNDRLALARSKIGRMSGEEKRNYTMLYQILMFILNELPEKGGIPNISNSFIVHTDGLFDLDIDCTESEGLIAFNQLHARPLMLIPEDVDML
jgi:hypothetical protein